MDYRQISIGKKFGMKIKSKIKSPEVKGAFNKLTKRIFLRDTSMSNVADTQRAKDPLIVNN